MNNIKPFTKEQEQQIRNEFLTKPIKRLSDEMGIHYGRITRFLKRNNLEIPKEIIEQRKKDSQKKKGCIPFNKGRKQVEYMTKQGIESSKKTRFKKGHKPKCMLSVGTEKLTKDGYIKVKISNPNKWELKQRVIYEKHHGIKLKKRDMVIFLDKNNRNFKPENLKKISTVENMLRNSNRNYPKEIIPTLLILNKIKNELRTA